MTSILTGDIIGSRKALHAQEWLTPLKTVLASFGSTPEKWEIYRGDSFQLEISQPEKALEAALLIKSTICTIKSLDVRIAIGIGEKNYDAGRITESNGTAFQHSGDCFESLKKQKRSLAIKTGLEETDEELNMLLHLGLGLMDRWKPASAELITTAIQHQQFSQQEIASLLNIRQSTVSAGLKRAHFSQILDLNTLCRKKIMAIFNE